MALPAGRYGVTKNQLLKIKKLPMNTIKLIEELTEKFDLLGTAAFKNSTSVVTSSSDLVESGAVEQTLRDAEVIEGKNLYADEQDIQFGSAYNTRSKYIQLTKPLGAGTYTLNMKHAGTTNVILQIRYNGSYQGVPSLPYTFTVNSGSTCDMIYAYISQDDYDGGKSATASKIQIEAGTVATAYEPYYIPLKDVVPNKCDNSVIGTVEDGTNPTKSYAVGEHMIRGGKFCTVTSPVTTSSTWVLNSNYVEGTIADNLVKQDTFSGTTSSTGIAEIYNGNRNVIKCESSGGNRIIQPFYSYSRSKVMARCIYENGSVIENDVVSGTYYYI